MKAKRQPELYGTSDVAMILNIPEWRVKNFSEGAAYRLPPAQRIGTGRGSRRLYRLEDVFRIGLADLLVKFGFQAEEVGQAVSLVGESVLVPFINEPCRSSWLLVKHEHGWKVAPSLSLALSKTRGSGASQGESATPWKKVIEDEKGGLFVINVTTVFNDVRLKLERHVGDV